MKNLKPSFVYKRPRLSRKVWITHKELPNFFKLIMSLSTLKPESVSLFSSRVESLVKASGFQFAFVYLKECLRLTLKALSGQPEVHGSGKTYVRRDKDGLPTIIPGDLRWVLRTAINDPVRRSMYLSPDISMILTCLSVFRVFKVNTPVSLDTIVSEFSGTSRTLNGVQESLFDLFGRTGLRLLSFRLIGGESAGPNGWKAIWSTGVDALSMLYYPKQLISFVRLSFRHPNGVWFSLWMITLILLLTPIHVLTWLVDKFEVFILWILGLLILVRVLILTDIWFLISMRYNLYLFVKFFVINRNRVDERIAEVYSAIRRKLLSKRKFGFVIPKMGKLSVVYDQAGKARVVAITNWWIQLCLKPLHDSLFRKLRKLSEVDGTFDQDGALDNLIERTPRGQKFYSFDLSAATDRLPVDIQVAILNSLSPGYGTIWKSLLDFSWFYKDKYINYSVGQPMGAYSSWAMLAITHHVIVRMAALRAGICGFKGYAVLGDDVVIANDAVASEYSFIMKTLGVSLNPSKSIESYDFCEFAKRLRGKGIEWTPLGPGLLLRVLRDKFYISRALIEINRLRWITSSSDLLAIFRYLNLSVEMSKCILWNFFGINKCRLSKPFETDHPVAGRMVSLSSGLPRSTPLFIEFLPELVEVTINNAVCDLVRKLYNQRVAQAVKDKDFFYQNWWRVLPFNSWSMRVLESLRIITPGFWYLALGYEKIDDIFEEFRVIAASSCCQWANTKALLDLVPSLDVSSIDWRDRKVVKDTYKSLIELHMDYQDAYDSVYNIYSSYRDPTPGSPLVSFYSDYKLEDFLLPDGI